MEKIKRLPPNYRNPDTCEKCRAFEGECKFYEFKEKDPSNQVCDDFRKGD
jgi:hypothetical protein